MVISILNRRKLYRVALGANVGLDARICAKAGIEISVQIVDLSYAGVGLLVPRSIRQTLKVGQSIALKFESEALKWRVSASGHVQNLIEHDGDYRVGIEFSDSGAVDDQLTPTLRPLFNRRQAYRTETKILGDTICKWCPIDRDVAETTLRGHLIDISGCGFAMSTSMDHDALLIPHLRFRTHVAVDQEGIQLDFTLIAQLRNKAVQDKILRVGFKFEEDDSSFFRDQQNALFRFVAEVQRRILKENSDIEKF
jgi:c-di-GMP-binding flagellar brake protein YcgR